MAREDPIATATCPEVGAGGAPPQAGLIQHILSLESMNNSCHVLSAKHSSSTASLPASSAGPRVHQT
eukprot:239069-Hanusia_phi.AAC.1